MDNIDLQSRNYEVAINISDTDISCSFPYKLQRPSIKSRTHHYHLHNYPKYAIYHLIMSDIIRRCQVLKYDTSLINVYYNGNNIAQRDIIRYFQFGNDDLIKHNIIGELIHAIAFYGITPDIINTATQHGVLHYLYLITFMSGVSNE